jgi:hypothetical protein
MLMLMILSMLVWQERGSPLHGRELHPARLPESGYVGSSVGTFLEYFEVFK